MSQNVYLAFQTKLINKYDNFKEIRVRIIHYILTILVLVLISSSAQAVQVPGPLVETNWLAENISQVVILDVRGDLQSFTFEPKFFKDKKTGKQHLVRVGGHIANASLVNFKEVRADRKVGKNVVKNMLPEKDVFEKLIQKAGVNEDSTIIIVSKGSGGGDILLATRLYWQLKYYGHDNLAILNGGLAQWLIENREVSVKPVKPSPGNWVASAQRDELLATSEEVATESQTKSAQLVDIRPIGQYLGTYKSSSVSALGHIPGARNFPTELIFTSGVPTKLVSKQQAQQLATALEIKSDGNQIAYCNTGNMASGGWFFFSEVLGYKNTQLYDGSMHQWTLEKRPTVTMVME